MLFFVKYYRGFIGIIFWHIFTITPVKLLNRGFISSGDLKLRRREGYLLLLKNIKLEYLTTF